MSERPCSKLAGSGKRRMKKSYELLFLSALFYSVVFPHLEIWDIPRRASGSVFKQLTKSHIFAGSPVGEYHCLPKDDRPPEDEPLQIPLSMHLFRPIS